MPITSARTTGTKVVCKCWGQGFHDAKFSVTLTMATSTLTIVQAMSQSQISLLNIVKVIVSCRVEDQTFIAVQEVPLLFSLIFSYENFHNQAKEWILCKAVDLCAGNFHWLLSASFGLRGNACNLWSEQIAIHLRSGQ